MQINSINIALNNNLINSVEISKANFLHTKNSPQKIDKFEKTNLQNSPSFEGLLSKSKNIINFVPAKNLEEANNFAEKTLGIKYFEIKNLELANWVNEGLSNLKNYTKVEFPENILSKNFQNNVFAETSYNEKSITFNENYETKYFDNYLQILENKVLIKKKNKYYPININLANQKEIDEKAISILKEKEKLSDRSSSLKIMLLFQEFLNEVSDKYYAKLRNPEFFKNSNKYTKKVLEEKYDKFATIYHEMGHVKHIKKEIITKKGRFLLKELTPKQLEKFKKTVSLISPYATKNYVEFVAEFYEKMVSRFIEIRKESPKMPVFLAKIKAKREWPKNLRILYKKSGGPAL